VPNWAQYSAANDRYETELLTLQFLGQPAIAEGNVIYLGDNVLEIAQACSGLRIFIGIGALAYAYVVIVRRTWWEKGCCWRA